MTTYQVAEYTLPRDRGVGRLALDPLCINGISREVDPNTRQELTLIHTDDGMCWEVCEGYVEAIQIWIEARTHNETIL